MQETKRFFDLEEIRALPIKEVCAAFGIPVDRSNFIKLRSNERTASTKLYINKGVGADRFYDFGSQIGGDCINLIEQYQGCSWQDALEMVADAFGIQPVNNTEFDKRGVLSNTQWLRIGVYGDLVSKNLDFDLEKFSMDSAMKYANKYNMSVNELRESNPNFYIAAILRNKAFPYVYGMQNSYYMQMYSIQCLQKNIVGKVDFELLSENDIKELEESRQKLTSAEKLLKLAIRGTDVRFTFREYNVEKDWEDMCLGKISFEVGPKNNAMIKQIAKKDNLNVLYKKISADAYFSLDLNLLENVPHAAFLKGDEVNLVYIANDEKEIEKMLSEAKDEHTLVAENDSLQKTNKLSSKITEAENKKSDFSEVDQTEVRAENKAKEEAI